MSSAHPPFLYLGPSVADHRKFMACDIWFKNEIPPEQRAQIEACIPYPLGQIIPFRWGRTLLHCETDDAFSFRCRTKYGNLFLRLLALTQGHHTLANPNGLRQFHSLLDQSLIKIHKIQTIEFIYKERSDLYEQKDSNVHEQYSSWHQASVQQIESLIAPLLTNFLRPSESHSQSPTPDEKVLVARLSANLFSYIPRKISPESARTFSQMLSAAIGHDEDLDSSLKQILNKLELIASIG